MLRSAAGEGDLGPPQHNGTPGFPFVYEPVPYTTTTTTNFRFHSSLRSRPLAVTNETSFAIAAARFSTS